MFNFVTNRQPDFGDPHFHTGYVCECRFGGLVVSDDVTAFREAVAMGYFPCPNCHRQFIARS